MKLKEFYRACVTVSALGLVLSTGLAASSALAKDGVAPKEQPTVKNATIKQGESLDLLSLITAPASSDQSDSNIPPIPAKRPLKPSTVLNTYGVDIPAVGDTDNLPVVNPGDDNIPSGQWYKDSLGYTFLKWQSGDNWYDVNKFYRHQDRPYGSGGTDNWACWAASSSNQMRWWITQNRKYVDKYFQVYPNATKTISNGKDLNTLFTPYDPSQYDPYLDYYVEHFKDKTGYQTGANYWFITGHKNPQLAAPFKDQEFGRKFPGFFSQVFPGNTPESKSLVDYEKYPRTNAKQKFSQYVVESLRNNRSVGFELVYAGSYRHVVTLWGVELNDQGLVDYIYYVDSDSNDDNSPDRTRGIMRRTQLLTTEDGKSLRVNSRSADKNYTPSSSLVKVLPEIRSVNSLGLGSETWDTWYRQQVGAGKANAYRVKSNGGFDPNTPGTYTVIYEDEDGVEVDQRATVTVQADSSTSSEQKPTDPKPPAPQPETPNPVVSKPVAPIPTPTPSKPEPVLPKPVDTTPAPAPARPVDPKPLPPKPAQTRPVTPKPVPVKPATPKPAPPAPVKPALPKPIPTAPVNTKPSNPKSGQANHFAVLVVPQASNGSVVFRDVVRSAPFFHEISWMRSKGLSTGWPDGSYRPYASIDRNAMIAFIYRLSGSPKVISMGKPLFKDVKPGDPFYKEIQWAGSNGITRGWSDGTFRPYEKVNRDAMAAFMYRLVHDKKIRPKSIDASLADLSMLGQRVRFTDISGSGFQKEIQWCSKAGISTGWPDGTFRPGLPVARNAMAAFIFRLSNNHVAWRTK